MKFLLQFPLLFLFFGCATTTEFKNVIIPKPTSASYKQSQVEPSIAIHPNNPKMMVAGTVMNDYYYSTNGGKTWLSTSLKSKYGVGGDPVLHISKKGIYYYTHLSHPDDFGHRMDRIVCQSSQIISGDWEDAATAVNGTKLQDKPWIAECPKSGNLYLTWTQFDAYKSANPTDSSFIYFSKSEDDGKTWSQPMRISKFGGDCMDGNLTVEGAVPTVNEDGIIFVGWTGPAGIRLNMSLDFGETWLEEEMFVTEQPLGWKFDIPGIYRCNGLPITTIDRSGGTYNNRLYINWTDQRDGVSNTNNWLIYSDDFGQSWSTVIKVNQDEKEAHQFFTWMTIDQSNGSLYWIYYDRRNQNDHQTDVYLAYSFDGASTIKELKISESPFMPNDQIFFGDYTNIAAVNGVIRPIWSRMDNNQITLLTALISEKKLKNRKH